VHERAAKEGESPVSCQTLQRPVVEESCTLILVHQAGDKLLLRLDVSTKPIEHKYCEGKMKSTLERKLKDLKSLRRTR